MRELLIGVSITVSLAIASAMHYVNDNGVDLIFTFYSLLMAPQVNYLHSHGLAHTELRLENVHISPIDKHVKVSCNFVVIGHI